ncbi:MAG: aminotransferase class I/II-fold pyridoxal phosphate-dependent enzyme [Alphaproteobacteria bacterium]|nr:aminotransferase class I/II-fold pyridoxal phosphate-dependent enzyme [Alphaproteobacteria bacterium]
MRGHPESVAAQGLGWVEPTTHAVVPPIHVATTYERAGDLSYPGGRVYGRDGNPSYEQPEAVIAALEGGAGCYLFASGMAAATACFMALSPGDHVVAPTVMYWGLRRWLLTTAKHWRLQVDLVDTGDLDALAHAMKPGWTKLVWIETPSNPLLGLTDIAAAADIAHAAKARLAVDSTAATPVHTRPLALGADIVMHAATKALNGHSDVVAGALVTRERDAYWDLIRTQRAAGGAVSSGFDAWLLLRGMRTLYLRVERAAQNADTVARFLHGHPKVAEVFYPGLVHHPGHAIARKQMERGFGHLLSFRVKGGQEGAVACAAALRLIKRATSLGGVESLVEHRASVEGPDSPAPPDLLRLSVGIEHVEDLIEDLDQALAAVKG